MALRNTSKLGKHAKKFVPIYFIHFYIIRKKNALETIRKVSCSIIYFLMFAKSKFLIFLVVSVSLSGSTRLAVEDGCNSGYCFGASGESFVSKISVFSNMMFCWFMS